MSSPPLLFSGIINSENIESFVQALYQVLKQGNKYIFFEKTDSHPSETKDDLVFKQVHIIRNGNFLDIVIEDTSGKWCLTQIRFYKSFDTFPYAEINSQIIVVKNRLKNNQGQLFVLHPLVS